MDKKQSVPIIAANWKMYKTLSETEQFITQIKPLIAKAKARVLVAVPFTSLKTAVDLAKDTNLIIGAQNMNDASEGAFTGEIAAKMLTDVGAKFVLIGHSERRQYFNESNAFINRKVKRALESNLQPLLCIGETLKERESGEMEDVLATQLSESLQDVETSSLKNVIIAYEPVWAIGTGISATADMAQQAHHFCREYLAQHWGAEVAGTMPLLYGGSVKPNTAAELLGQSDINGLLVGGASLDATSFAAIVNAG